MDVYKDVFFFCNMNSCYWAYTICLVSVYFNSQLLILINECVMEALKNLFHHEEVRPEIIRWFCVGLFCLFIEGLLPNEAFIPYCLS